MIKREKRFNTCVAVIMWVMSLIILAPLAMIGLNSVKSVAESAVMSLRLPTELHFENFVTVLKDPKLVRSFFNSLVLTTGTTLTTIVLSSAAAFVLSRSRTRVNRMIYMVILLGLVAPVNYITSVKVMQMLGLINTVVGVILLYTAQYIPFTVFIYYGFVGGISKTLDEAALMDGCTGMRLFYTIIFPLLKPVTMTALVLNALYCWNDFIIPLYFLNSSQKWGIVMLMYNYFSQFISSWNLVCATMIVVMTPIVILYIIGQKYLISGITSGALKG